MATSGHETAFQISHPFERKHADQRQRDSSHKGAVMLCVDVSFNINLNKTLLYRWFEMPWSSRDVTLSYGVYLCQLAMTTILQSIGTFHMMNICIMIYCDYTIFEPHEHSGSLFQLNIFRNVLCNIFRTLYHFEYVYLDVFIFSFICWKAVKTAFLATFNVSMYNFLEPVGASFTQKDWFWTGHWLTYWGRDTMAAIFQTAFSHAFSWMKMIEFRLRFHWSLFPRVKLTIFQHVFR